MLRNWKMRAKLLLIVGVNVVNVLFIAFAAIVGMRVIQAELRQIKTEDLVLTKAISKVTEHQFEQAIEFERAIRYGVRGNRKVLIEHQGKFRELKGKIGKELTEIEKKTEEVLEHAKNKDVRENFKELKRAVVVIEGLHKNYELHADEVFALLRRGEIETAERKTKAIESKEDKLTRELEKLLGSIEKFTEQAVERAESHEILARYVIMFIAVFGTIIGVMLSLLIARGITKPMALAISDIKTIAADGNLTIRLDDKGRDEIGENARWVNQLVEKIHDIITEISQGSGDISNSSDSLNEASQSMSTGAEEMSQQSQTIAAASNEMSQNLLIVANATEEMSTSISEVTRQAIEAARVAAEANANADKTNTVVSELGEDARRIGVVTESISDIADQTNLLALNAAIEAASAGEAGKGFAVVASEVKELARQASESAEDIKARIQTVQSGTEQTVVAIQAITKVIGQLNEINSAIASAMEEQSITTREIASNVSQTSGAAAEVSKNIEGISEVARDGTRSADNTFTLAQALKKLAANLQKIVHQFKTDK